jgi:hypothetical protein
MDGRGFEDFLAAESDCNFVNARLMRRLTWDYSLGQGAIDNLFAAHLSFTTMYKHIQKSLKRGVDISDEDDSDDSASSSGEESEQSLDDRSDIGSDDDGSSEEPSEEESEAELDLPDDLPTVEEAIERPICSVAGANAQIRQCVLCPGKILKTADMVKEHELSKVWDRIGITVITNTVAHAMHAFFFLLEPPSTSEAL